MVKYREVKEVDVNKDVVFDLVAKVEDYPKFLIFCEKTTLIKVEDNFYFYKMDIKSSIINSSFTTKVEFIGKDIIKINLVEGPFKELKSQWQFNAKGEDKTEIIFEIEFTLANPFFNMIAEKAFKKISKKIVEVFITKLNKK